MHSKAPLVTSSFHPDISAETSLGKLLRTIARRLPLELQTEIQGYLEPHLVSSLLRTYSAVRELAVGRRRKPCCKRFARPAKIRCLYVETRRVFGLDYITEIGYNKDCRASIKTDNLNVRGLRFALGRYGLRAIRILYDNGASPWLGCPEYCWYGEVYGTDLGRIWVFRDVSMSWVTSGGSPNVGL